MTASTNHLDTLWKRLRDVKVGALTYEGLASVDFSMSLEAFREYHARHAVIGHTSVIASNAEEALAIVQRGTIYEHHIFKTPSFDTKTGAQGALCVHYNVGDMLFALAIPGIKYKRKK